MVNGSVAEMGMKVSSQDHIEVDQETVDMTVSKEIFLAFNKPVGIVCTTDSRVEKNNIIDYINYPVRVFPVGRLDKRSQGLILLTNDGETANKILKASNFHEKEYEVRVDKPVTPDFIKRMSGGIPILGTVTRKCHVEKINSNSFRIILTQGLNRQIRRMCEYLGYRVRHLKRTRIMNIDLDIPIGSYRELSEIETENLKNALNASNR